VRQNDADAGFEFSCAKCGLEDCAADSVVFVVSWRVDGAGSGEEGVDDFGDRSSGFGGRCVVEE
jgi:hypothetical protein